MTDLLSLLDAEIRPTVGCTEPVAVAYAASLAYHAILGRVPDWLRPKQMANEGPPLEADDAEIVEIQVLVDRDVYKNALAVGIPRSGGETGIDLAAAMGVYCYPEAEGAEETLFRTLRAGDLEKGRALVDRVKVELVGGWEDRDGIIIQVSVVARDRHRPQDVVVGTARIERTHDNVTYIGVERRGEGVVAGAALESREALRNMTVAQIVTQVDELSEPIEEKMIDMLETNLSISREGLEDASGLGVGAALRRWVDEGSLGDDPVTLAQMLAASAADARMAGMDCAVISSAGSGNQGIVATLPLVAVATKLGCDVPGLCAQRRAGTLSADESDSLRRLLQALALSNVITSYVTYHTSRLSAMCGCAIKAGIGAAAGIAYLLDADIETVEGAIQNMAASITGMICDGAKEGCALKLTSAASAAVLAARLAAAGIRVKPGNGIVSDTVEETIVNLDRVCQAMITTDVELANILRDRTAAR